ncbi:MAG: hypothetical protein P9L92_20645 [Candidatus Electryonea clarkiae]|nr:hypothetical protein [Candidatus Electryonea clarkiae]MDP8288878.1 hypothetical protein [Candidatus Electryonea clarkiae]
MRCFHHQLRNRHNNNSKTISPYQLRSFTSLLIIQILISLACYSTSYAVQVGLGPSIGRLHQVSPGARAAGMGEAQTALLDPLAGHFNPGSMGIYSLDHRFSFSYFSANWQDIYYTPILYMDHTQIFTGLKLEEKTKDNSLEISCGIDLGRRYFDLGDRELRGENNEYLGTYNPWEKHYSVGVSLGLRRIIEFGAGYKLNFLTSEFVGYWGHPGVDYGYNDRSFDLGVLIRLPFNNALDEMNIINLNKFVSPFTIDFIPSFGYSQSNLPIDNFNNENIPEVYRNGYALEFRLDHPAVPLMIFIFAQDNIKEKDIRFRYPLEWIETSGIGREISFFDSFIYRWGEYYYGKHGDSRITTGFTMQTRGIFNILYSIEHNRKSGKGNWYNFVMNRVNIGYSRLSREGKYQNYLVPTEWLELGINF